MDGSHRSEALDGAGEGTPRLDLDGFSGTLDQLLALARAHEINLTRLSVVALVDQLAVALDHAPPAMKLGQKGNWVVMTAWLLQLRSGLLLPADPAAQEPAEGQAVALRDHLIDLQAMQALARWLQNRPQLGQDVFARGQPEDFATAIGAAHEVDVVGFLWASLALFDEADDVVDTTAVYQPPPRDWYPIAAVRAHILALLAETPAGDVLARFLPDLPPPTQADGAARSRRLRRLAWSSTFTASLELAKRGDLTLAQEGLFAPIHVGPPGALPPP